MKPFTLLQWVLVASVILFSSVDSAIAQIWTQATNAPSKTWWSVASSADGTKLVAAAYGGAIYTSPDSGVTWISNNVPVRNWFSVASSADGMRLVAVINVISTAGAGGIYNSPDGGARARPGLERAR